MDFTFARSVQLHTLTCFCLFSETKMTLAEFKSLVETMQNLPCVMNQLEDVQVRTASYVILNKCFFQIDFLHTFITKNIPNLRMISA